MNSLDSSVSSSQFSQWIDQGKQKGQLTDAVATSIVKGFSRAFEQAKQEGSQAPAVITTLFSKELENIRNHNALSDSLVTLLKEGSKAAILFPKKTIDIDWVKEKAGSKKRKQDNGESSSSSSSSSTASFSILPKKEKVTSKDLPLSLLGQLAATSYRGKEDNEELLETLLSLPKSERESFLKQIFVSTGALLHTLLTKAGGDITAISTTFLHALEGIRNAKIDLDLHGLPLDDTKLYALIKFFPNVTKLNLEGCSYITDAGIQATLGRCTQLTHLNLAGHYLSEKTKDAIATQLPELTTLHLISSNSGVNTVTDEWLDRLGKNCSQLENLYISINTVTDKGTEAIAKNCKKLRKLELLNAFEITGDGLCKIMQDCKLDSLVLENSKLSDRDLANMSGYGKQLLNLELYDCESITDKGLEAIASGFTQLEALTIEKNDHITDSGVESLTQCKQLIKLNFTMCELITNKGLDKIITNCPNLIHFSLLYCEKVEITDRELYEISVYCPQLIDLQFNGKHLITKRGIDDLTKNGKFVHLGLGTEVDDEGLHVIAKNCPKLKVMNLMGSPVTYEGVKELLTQLKSIIHILDIDDTKVTSDQYLLLKQEFPNLVIEF
ncbi:MAG: F-box/LRR-repeat protein 7-like [Chlamydiia bacterium]|nr:F-box/LRR-repeat protein 7-like [Chlamydiia bacterium]